LAAAVIGVTSRPWGATFGLAGFATADGFRAGIGALYWVDGQRQGFPQPGAALRAAGLRGRDPSSPVARPGRVRTRLTLICLAAAVGEHSFGGAAESGRGGFLRPRPSCLFIAFRLNVRAGRLSKRWLLTPGQLIFRRVKPSRRLSNGAQPALDGSSTRSTTTKFGLQKLALFSARAHTSSPWKLSPLEREEFSAQFGKALGRREAGM
jgi:hypothetical protein